MSQSFLPEIIRYDTDSFTTPNIYGVDQNGLLEISCKQFREKNKDTELFFFVCFENYLYFPIWFEFRSINNNLLYLIEEYEINTFSMLQKVLNSSLKKEEHWSVEMKAIIYHSKKCPTFSFPLTDFKIEPEFAINIYE